MPIYLYRNLATGETFEYEQRITENALITHPETGEPVKRLIQPVGIAFKGSGFYVNDARKNSRTPPASKDAALASSGSSTSSSDNSASSASTATPTATPAAAAAPASGGSSPKPSN
jgi:putative FmdB family regulatory protein